MQTGARRGDGEATILYPLHESLAFAVFFNVDKIVVNALLPQELLAALAITIMGARSRVGRKRRLLVCHFAMHSYSHRLAVQPDSTWR